MEIDTTHASRRRALRHGLIALGLAALPVGCSSQQPAKPKQPLRLAADKTNPLLQLPWFVARQRKLFEAQRLRFTEVPFQADGTGADISLGAFYHVLLARTAGAALTGFAVLCRSPLLVLASKPHKRERHRVARDLEGDTIAVTTQGDQTELFVKYVTSEDGLPSGDFETTATGSLAASAASLEKGEIDAAVLDSATAKTLETRVPELEILSDTRTLAGLLSTYGVSNYPACCAFADSSWLLENREEARRVARALRAATEWIRTHQAKDVAAALPKEYRDSMDAALLNALIDEGRPLLSVDLEFTPDGVEAVREVLAVSNENFRDVTVSREAYTNDVVRERRR